MIFEKYFLAIGHERSEAENVAAEENQPAKKRRVDAQPKAAESVSNYHYKGMNAKKIILH